MYTGMPNSLEVQRG